jgi:hypothetical protein
MLMALGFESLISTSDAFIHNGVGVSRRAFKQSCVYNTQAESSVTPVKLGKSELRLRSVVYCGLRCNAKCILGFLTLPFCDADFPAELHTFEVARHSCPKWKIGRCR